MNPVACRHHDRRHLTFIGTSFPSLNFADNMLVAGAAILGLFALGPERSDPPAAAETSSLVDSRTDVLPRPDPETEAVKPI
jgi:hypothetical protein